MNWYLLSSLIVMCFWCFGCGSIPVKTVPLTQKWYPPTDPLHVKIFWRNPAKAPYEVLAVMSCEFTSDDSAARLESTFREKAATMGGDAVVIFDRKSEIRTTSSVESGIFHWGYYTASY